jgi:transcriptional regulator with PAS, ATPase and Fis domain
MVFDAVSNHHSGMLSMETFKPFISMEQDQRKDTESSSELISFHDQLPTLKEIEDLLVEEAMKRAGNNQSIAAMSLGISRQALNKRLSKTNR